MHPQLGFRCILLHIIPKIEIHGKRLLDVCYNVRIPFGIMRAFDGDTPRVATADLLFHIHRHGICSLLKHPDTGTLIVEEHSMVLGKPDICPCILFVNERDNPHVIARNALHIHQMGS
ncbi:hypothetical protein ACKS0A_10530 [Histoplasma ohiense]